MDTSSSQTSPCNESKVSPRFMAIRRIISNAFHNRRILRIQAFVRTDQDIDLVELPDKGGMRTMFVVPEFMEQEGTAIVREAWIRLRISCEVDKGDTLPEADDPRKIVLVGVIPLLSTETGYILTGEHWLDIINCDVPFTPSSFELYPGGKERFSGKVMVLFHNCEQQCKREELEVTRAPRDLYVAPTTDEPSSPSDSECEEDVMNLYQLYDEEEEQEKISFMDRLYGPVLLKIMALLREQENPEGPNGIAGETQDVSARDPDEDELPRLSLKTVRALRLQNQ